MFYSRVLLSLGVLTLVYTNEVPNRMPYPISNPYLNPPQFNPYLNFGYNFPPYLPQNGMSNPFYPGFPFKPNTDQLNGNFGSFNQQNIPYQHIPTEIIDVDDKKNERMHNERVDLLATTTQKVVDYSAKPLPTKKPSHVTYVGGIKYTESKPIVSSLRRTITSNGLKSQRINIHMINGVEVTESPSSTTIEPEAAEQADEVSAEDPKPVKSWLFG